MRISILVFFFFTTHLCFAQKQGNIWVFGDSAAIDFNSGSPIPYLGTGLYAHECSSTIADENGNLQFYVGANVITGYFESAIFNKYNKIIQNGVGIFNNSSSSQGCILFPSPSDTNEIYLITHRADASISDYQVYFSIINKSANNDSGAVIIKNMLLPGINNMAEQMSVLRHGNGVDWWFITHKLTGNEFCIYLIDSNGISNPNIVSIGTPFSVLGSIGNMKFSPDGNKLVVVGGNGSIDLYLFDRCSGIISSWVPIGIIHLGFKASKHGCSFSPNSKNLYISDLDSGLYQYNLDAPIIINSKQLIWTNTDTLSIIGKHLNGADGKIYIAHEKAGFNIKSMNLSVINSPDSLGAACDFQPYSFNLGGRRSFGGLPNIPDYNLGVMVGSLCDTIVSLTEIPAFEDNFTVYPNPAANVLNIAIHNSEPIIAKLVNVLGQHIFVTEFRNQINIDVSAYQRGIYFLQIEDKTGVMKTVKKIVLQ